MSNPARAVPATTPRGASPPLLLGVLEAAEAAVKAGALRSGEVWSFAADTGDGVRDAADVPHRVVFRAPELEAFAGMIRDAWSLAAYQDFSPSRDASLAPQWVVLARARAMSVATSASSLERRVAAMTCLLTESILPLTAADQFRVRVHREAVGHSAPDGRPVVSQRVLDALATIRPPASTVEAARRFEQRLVPIMLLAAGRSVDPQVDVFFGCATKFSECRLGARRSLGAAWRGFFPRALVQEGECARASTERPRSGDVVILQVTGRGDLHAAAILDSVSYGETRADRPELGPEELWTLLVGGQELLDDSRRRWVAAPAARVRARFDPSRCYVVVEAERHELAVLGWIDTAELYWAARHAADLKRARRRPRRG